MRRSAFALAVALVAFGCQDKAPAPTAPTSVVAIGLEPIPAPQGLLAEISLATPDATWARARAAAGGPALFLPVSFAAAVLSVLELPITLAGEIDGTLPVVGAIVQGAEGEPSLALAIHVKAGDRLADMLTKGDAARFSAASDPDTKLALLTPRGPSPAGSASPPPSRIPSPRFALGVLGHYLVVARSVADLKTAAPYAARTLATKPAGKDDVVVDVPGAALSGPIATGARSLLARWKESGGSAALLRSGGFDALVEALPDLAYGKLTANIDASAAHVVVALEPKPGGGAASKLVSEMGTGDAKPLLDLPENTAAAALFRSSTGTTKSLFEGDAALASVLLGKDASKEDQAAVEAALRAIYDQRGEWVAFGAVVASTGPTGFARAPVKDPTKVQKAIDQLLELGKLASLKAELAKRHVELTASKTAIENLPGDVRQIRFAKVDDEPKDKGAKDKGDKKKDTVDPKAKAGDPPDARQAVDLLYLVGKDMLFASAGFDPKQTMKVVVQGDKTLGSLAPVRAALEALGATSSAVIFVDAHKVVPGALPAEPEPVVLAIGKQGAGLVVRLDAAVTALQELARRK